VVKLNNLKYEIINKNVKIFAITNDNYLEIKDAVSKVLSLEDTKDRQELISKFIKLNNKIYGYLNVESFGKIYDDVNIRSILKNEIPYTTFKQDKELKKSFYCFQGHTGEKTNVIVHEDIGSSINCLLEKLGNPKYCIIITK